MIAIGMFVTFIGWWMAVTESVTREGLSLVTRTVLVVATSLFPPMGILVVSWFIRKDRKTVSKAMKAIKIGRASSGALGLPTSHRTAKAA